MKEVKLYSELKQENQDILKQTFVHGDQMRDINIPNIFNIPKHWAVMVGLYHPILS
jgi:hypothetical protein